MKPDISRLRKEVLINNIFLIIMLGALLNLCVVLNNEMKMPIYFESEKEIPKDINNLYKPYENKSEVNFPFLSDKFQIKFSMGDVLFIGGMITLSIVILHSFIFKIKRRYKNGISISNK